MRHRRIAVRTHDRRWLEVKVEVRPSVRHPLPAITQTPMPAPTPVPEPRRFRMERSPDGQPRTLEIVTCD